MIRLLFLDVDGVLNSRATYELSNQGIHPPGPLGMVFTVCKDAVARLRALVEELDVKIVLSSTWRYHPHAFDTAMKWCGWDVELLGKTPRHADCQRGDEIAHWLEEYCEANPGVEVRYAIVDDSIDDIWQASHLVRTRTETGLLDEHIAQLRALLA